jgi:hypothetical protein
MKKPRVNIPTTETPSTRFRQSGRDSTILATKRWYSNQSAVFNQARLAWTLRGNAHSWHQPKQTLYRQLRRKSWRWNLRRCSLSKHLEDHFRE